MSNARRAYRLVPPAVKTGRPHFLVISYQLSVVSCQLSETQQLSNSATQQLSNSATQQLITKTRPQIYNLKCHK